MGGFYSVLLASLHIAILFTAQGATSFTWGTDKIRGVNIGGWLLLEPWITPSIFENVDQTLGIIDEYTLCERLPTQALQILRDHWDTFVGFDDFQKIASAGMNMVRIPIGFWAFNSTGTPYLPGAAAYLELALAWARATEPPLKVMIDLHGAPGSQNGFDNSGQKLDAAEIKFLRGGVGGQTAQETLDVIAMIAEKYAGESYQDVVAGVMPLNEPLGGILDNNDLRAFFGEAYFQVRQFGDTVVVIPDAFLPPASFNGFLSTAYENDTQDVAIDHHHYQVFDHYLVGMTPAEHIQQVCRSVESYAGADKWTLIGEWSGAMTDCARYLNGYGTGARYDGSRAGEAVRGSCVGKSKISSWDQQMKDDTRRYIEAQLDVFEENTEGWIFWTATTEGAGEWDLFELLDNGVFPNPVASRRFLAQC